MYKSFNKFVFRTPYYPVSILEKALSDDSAFLKILNTKYFQNAILLASPSLYDELIKYIREELPEKEKRRTKNALTRYLSRMATRSTPFGLFASCALCKIDEKSLIVLGKKTIVHSRLDMLCLCNLSQMLEQLPELRQSLNYYINTTLYTKGQKLRYIEYKFNTENRKFQLAEISQNPCLKAIIEASKNGINKRKIQELIMFHVEDISEDEADAYIDEIINHQLIVSEIDPVICGKDFFEHILSVLKRVNLSKKIYARLLTLKDLLEQLQENIYKNKYEIFSKIETEIKTLNIPYQKRTLLQVDSVREVKQACFGKEIIQDIQDCMLFLNKITPKGTNNTLNKFKEKFKERYESQEIPLLEVLDPELGIGYPPDRIQDINPLISGLTAPLGLKNRNQQATIHPIYTLLQRKILDFNPLTEKEVIFSDEDVKNWSFSWNDLPATMSTRVKIVGQNKVTNKHTLSLEAISGSTGGKLLGRFAYCNPDFEQFVNDIMDKEKEIYSQYIVAEISHIPNSRVGNVLARPTFRDYEIVYLSNTTRNRDHVIYPSDIMVSVTNNQIRLRSQTLNQYIIPRLTTAHNYRNDPTPIYLFLCDLQTQNLRNSLYLNKAPLEESLDFFPRIRYKNIILSPARWKIRTHSIDSIKKQKQDTVLMKEINNWREQLHLPRYVTLKESDNTLFVDLENINSVNAFLSTLSNKPQFILEEFLFDESSPVKDIAGQWFTNEFVIAFYKSETN